MSYDTYFSAKIEGSKEEIDAFILSVRLKELPETDYMTTDDWEELFWRGGFNGSWYEHKKDMQPLAKKYPNLTFILDGEGEEQGDVWREMYRGEEVRRWDMQPQTPPQTWEEMVNYEQTIRLLSF